MQSKQELSESGQDIRPQKEQHFNMECEININCCSLSLSAVGPGRVQEDYRRKVERGVREFWYFLHSEVKKLSHVDPAALQTHSDTLLHDLGHQQRLRAHTHTHAKQNSFSQ